MTRLNDAFAHGSFVPHTSPYAILYTLFFVFLGFIGLLLLTMILVSILKTGNTSGSMTLVISLCVTDWVLSLTSFVYGSIDISHNGFATGYYGCIINALLSAGMVCSSLLHIVSLSQERYLMIFYQFRFTDSQVYIWTATIWMLSFGLVTYPFYTGTIATTGYELSPSLMMCTGSWTSNDPIDVAFSSIALFVIFSSIGLNLFAYGRIILAYQYAFKSKLSRVDNVLQQRKEKKLVIKAAVLTLSYIICCFPYFSLIVLCTITNQPAPLSLDIIASILLQVNSSLNPMLLYIYDGRIRRNFCEYWGFDLLGCIKSWSKKSKNVKESGPTPVQAEATCPLSLTVMVSREQA